jgi:hypothetical protein
LGFSDADIDFIFESCNRYRARWSAHVATQSVPDSLKQDVLEIAVNSFQTGLVVAIAKARNLTKATNKFGFVP